MTKSIISTDKAPAAIGTYSQAVKVGSTVYLSGQIPLVPETMQMVSDDFTEQTHQVLKNLVSVCQAAGGEIQNMVSGLLALGHRRPHRSIFSLEKLFTRITHSIY